MKDKVIIILFLILVAFFLYKSDVIDKNRYPQQYSNYVEKYSQEYNIDSNLVYSIMKAESSFDPNAISRADAKGLMQISPITQNWAEEEMNLDEVDIYDPETNIMIACWYLNKLYREFGDTDLVIAAYNGGSGNVTKWLANEEYSLDGESLYYIPFPETANYLEKVNKFYEKYTEIYNNEG